METLINIIKATLASQFDGLAPPCVISGAVGELATPIIVIHETSCNTMLQGEVVMRGVMDIDFSITLISEADDLSLDDHDGIASQIYHIVADKAEMQTALNTDEIKTLHTEATAPIIELDDRRRSSVISFRAISCIKNQTPN